MSDPEFAVGEAFGLALDANIADISAFGLPVMKCQRLNSGQTDFDPDGNTPVSLSVVARAASGDIPAGWSGSLTSAQTAAMAPGRYVIDASALVGTQYAVSPALHFKLKRSVSRDA